MRFRFFSLRLALLALGATIAMLVFGGVEISESMRFRSPRVLTYEQFAAQMPQEGWYRITGARLEVVNGVWQEDKKTHAIDKVFVPLSSAGDKGGDINTPTKVMVEETDPAILQTAGEVKDLNGDAATIDFIKKNHDRAFIRRDVEGMVKTGLNSDSDTREKMAKLDNTSLASNWIMLKEGAHPSLGLGLLLFMGGGLLAVLQVLYYLRRRMTR